MAAVGWAMGEGQEGQWVWQQWGVSILFDVECVRMCCDKFLLCVCTRVCRIWLARVAVDPRLRKNHLPQRSF